MKQITVKELREQLEKLEMQGMANDPLWFRDWEDVDTELSEGILDTHGDGVVLG